MGKWPSKQVEMNIQKGFHKQRQGVGLVVFTEPWSPFLIGMKSMKSRVQSPNQNIGATSKDSPPIITWCELSGGTTQPRNS